MKAWMRDESGVFHAGSPQLYVDIMRQQWPCRRRRPPNPCIRMINRTNMINWFGPWLRVWGCGVSSTLAYNVKTYLSPSKFQLSIVLDTNLALQLFMRLVNQCLMRRHH